MNKHISLSGRRKHWALHQRDLAHLVGVTPSAISRYERDVATPTVRRILALEVIFGKSARYLFPRAYAVVQDEVMRRAAKLDRSLVRSSDAAAVRKRQLLSEMVRRGEAAADA